MGLGLSRGRWGEDFLRESDPRVRALYRALGRPLGWEPGDSAARFISAPEQLQARPTLCDPIDGSPTGSSVLGILQARILEWVATEPQAASGMGVPRPGGG